MLLKIITPFDIIENGVSVADYEPGEYDVTVPASRLGACNSNFV